MTSTLSRARGDIITVGDWQSAVESVEFPAYSYQFVGLKTNGGALDANRYAKAIGTLDSIESYGTKFLPYKDIRSNYWYATHEPVTTDTWVQFNAYDVSRFNAYRVQDSTSRLNFPSKLFLGVITTSANGMYMLYCELIIPEISAETSALMRLRYNGSVVAYFSQTGTLIAGQGFHLKGHYLSAYKGGEYSLEYYIGGTCYNASFVFGYTELIGNSSGCGG